MRWYYNVRQRRLVIKLSLIVLMLLISIIVIKAVFISNGSNNTGSKEVYSAVEDKESKPTPISSESPNPGEPLSTELPTPSTDISPTPSLQASPTITIEPSPSATPSPLSSPVPSPVVTLSPSKSPKPSPTKKPTPTPTKSPKLSPKKSPYPSPKKTIVSEAESTKVVLQYKNDDSSTSVKIINPAIKIINTGNKTIKLSDIKIRYYYSKEGTEKDTFWLDWFSLSDAQVDGKFVKLEPARNNASHYLQIDFYSTSKSINPGESAEIKIGFAKNDWSFYNQDNDYSFKSTTSYVDWNRITLYVSDKLVYGREP